MRKSTKVLRMAARLAPAHVPPGVQHCHVGDKVQRVGPVDIRLLHRARRRILSLVEGARRLGREGSLADVAANPGAGTPHSRPSRMPGIGRLSPVAVVAVVAVPKSTTASAWLL